MDLQVKQLLERFLDFQLLHFLSISCFLLFNCLSIYRGRPWLFTVISGIFYIWNIKTNLSSITDIKIWVLEVWLLVRILRDLNVFAFWWVWRVRDHSQRLGFKSRWFSLARKLLKIITRLELEKIDKFFVWSRSRSVG